MKLCLNCRQMSSDRALSGPSIFCPHCGLSFGVRRCGKCKKKASSPLDATYCVHCGGTRLTDATAYLNFGWLTGLVSLVLLGLLLRWGAALLHPLVSPSLVALSRNVQSTLITILDRLLFWVFFGIVLSAFLSFLPRHIVEPWHNALRGILRLAIKGTGRLVSWCWAAGWRSVVWLWQWLTVPRRRP